MARPIIVDTYRHKRNEILDTAQQLIYTKGYEQMSIPDILNQLHISKGAFYHYFDSKQALLEALTDRLLEEAEQALIPIVQDPNLPALDKLQRFFSSFGTWKTPQKGYLLALLRIWYGADNAIVRWKLRTARAQRLKPLLSIVIQQASQEGVIAATRPDQVAEVVLSLTQEFTDTLAGLFLAFEPGRGDLHDLLNTVAAYTEGLERILGLPTGSIWLVDEATLTDWLDSFNQKDGLPNTAQAKHFER